MAEKVSLKIFIVISFLCGILSACMVPIDIQTFVGDDKVKIIIENNKEHVILDPDTKIAYPYLTEGNKRITGLKSDKYYMIEWERDENDAPVPNTNYPNPTVYPRFVNETGHTMDDLAAVKRVTGGSIINLVNDHTYKVKEAAEFTGAEPTITTANAASSKTGNVITVSPNAAGTITITLGGFLPDYDGYEVKGVAVSGIANVNVPGLSDKQNIGTSEPGFNLQVPTATTNTVVDYVFAKGVNFEYLRVVVKPFGGGGSDQVTDKPIQITAPVTDVAPTSNISNTTQYMGTISWTPSVSGAFLPNTVYTAEITLSPVGTYTLAGLPSNFFTVTGATSVTFDGIDKVTVVFPATGPKPQGDVSVNITFTTPSEKFTDGSASINVSGAGGAAFSINISGIGAVSDIEWFKDGKKLTENSNTLNLSSIPTDLIGTHEFIVIARVDGVPYSVIFTLTVTQ